MTLCRSFLKKLYTLADKAEGISGWLPERIVLLLYVLINFVIGYFYHEPWYDEAEAWQIAKVVPYGKILFYVPHYEGHPPLWHLVLSIPAKLGAPYELSLILISICFTAPAVWLMLRYFKIPRLVKWCIPFMYYVCYQYGVISRPYCMMILAFVLLGISYEKRNEKPYFYTLSMFFLCLTSAYGIVIAAGIALAWCVEIVRGRKLTDIIKSVTNDKRVWCLTGLLVCAFCVGLLILPVENTYAVGSQSGAEIRNPFAVRLLYMFTAALPDAVITNVLNFTTSGFLKSVLLDYKHFALAIAISLVMWGGIVYIGKKCSTLLEFVIPYSIYGVFAAAVYYATHHQGILFLFLLYWINCSYCSRNLGNGFLFSYSDTESKSDYALAGHFIFAISICAGVLVGVYWTLGSCYYEIKENYGPGRYESAFIKEYHLDEYYVLADWLKMKDDDGNIEYQYPCLGYYTDNILAYCESMAIMNTGTGENAYTLHAKQSEEETEAFFAEIREQGAPDVLLGQVELSQIYPDDSVNMGMYALVYCGEYGKVWKAGVDKGMYQIYVRRDLLD